MFKFLLKLVSDKAIEDRFMELHSQAIKSDRFTPEEIEVIFTEASKIENLKGYLISVMGADTVRYFNAAPEIQERIKGAFQRTLWLAKKIQEPRRKAVGKPVKLTSSRHG